MTKFKDKFSTKMVLARVNYLAGLSKQEAHFYFKQKEVDNLLAP